MMPTAYFWVRYQGLLPNLPLSEDDRLRAFGTARAAAIEKQLKEEASAMKKMKTLNIIVLGGPHPMKTYIPESLKVQESVDSNGNGDSEDGKPMDEMMTSIKEHNYEHYGMMTKIIDARGMYTSRNKWMSYFEDVNVFVLDIDLASYLTWTTLDNGRRENTLVYMLYKFRDLCENNVFHKAIGIYIFMNNADKFYALLERYPLRIAFPEFPGPDYDHDGSLDYIINAFYTHGMSETRNMYIRVLPGSGSNDSKHMVAKTHDLLVLSELDLVILGRKKFKHFDMVPAPHDDRRRYPLRNFPQPLDDTDPYAKI